MLMSSQSNRPPKKLEQEWYQKLKDDGFEDIEDSNNPNRPLKAWHNFRFRQVNPARRKVTEAYYEKACALLHTYPFINEITKRIWELHCQGFSKREIEEAIKNESKRYKRESIGLIIVKISREIK